MTHRLTTLPPLLIAVLAIGCTSVPEVESRLRTLQFHPNMYVVRAGDTLETIAFRYRLPIEELASLNPGVGERPSPGTRINVRPGTELSEAVRARGDTPADTWSGSDLAAAPRSATTDDAVATRAVPRRAVVVEPEPLPEPIVPSAHVESTSAPLETVAFTEAPEPLGDAGAAGYPREEVVPDDFLPGEESSAARAALDAELQRYVGRWTWPTDGVIARAFEPERAGGQGVDITGVPGQHVRAALDGTVVYSGRDLSGGGNLVILRHDDELMTTYSHTDELFVAEDDRVLAGDPIASLGWNERREAVLTFEVRRDGDPLDPMAFLPSP